MKEKYQVYKERLEKALALAEGAPADKSVLEQKAPVDGIDSKCEEEQKLPAKEEATVEEPPGEESPC